MDSYIQHLHANAEQYRKQAQESDNDLKAFALYEKANREYRMVDFLKHTLPKIKELATAKIIKQDLVHGLFIVEFDGVGIVDIYPKKPAAKVRKPQKWHKFAGYEKFINKITTKQHGK